MQGLDMDDGSSPEVVEHPSEKEVECHRCYGTGDDDDGALCIYCEGYGTVFIM